MTSQYWRMAFVVAIGLLSAASASSADDGKHYQVFLLAGQSNMQGKAPIAMMEAQAEAEATRDLYQHLRKDGQWIVRDDVLCTYQMLKKGGLSVGFASPNRVGSELEFGTMMGEHFDEPVVLIKTCQGGISLTQGFRPPSSGLPSDEKLAQQLENAQKTAKARNQPVPEMDDIKKLYGEYYRMILADYKTVSDTWSDEFPVLKGRTPQLAGLVWFQGWNDQYGGAEQEYEANMKNFIHDIRKDLNSPKLPVVIVAMGQNGSTPAKDAMLTIRDAQLAMNDVPEFAGNVKAFRSDLLVDKDAERLWNQKDPAARERDKELTKLYAADDAYHYYGSAIWFHRIGHAMGDAMLELMKESK